MIAAQDGNYEMARILLKEGKCKKDQVDVVNHGISIHFFVCVAYTYSMYMYLCVHIIITLLLTICMHMYMHDLIYILYCMIQCQ